ncbi:MAG: glycerol kinase, partial [Flavobacteriales bacterium]
FLMQFQADVIQVNVNRPHEVESTALGAGFMAGIGAGVWTFDEVQTFRKTEAIFSPQKARSEVKKLYAGWKKAVSRTLGWLENDKD